MTGNTYQWPGMTASQRTEALKQEAAALKRARIMNGKEPGYKNGHPKSKEKTGV